MINLFTVAQQRLIAERMQKASVVIQLRVNLDFHVLICKDDKGSFGVTTISFSRIVGPQIGVFVTLQEDKVTELIDGVETYTEECAKASYLYSNLIDIFEIRYAQNIVDGKSSLNEELAMLKIIAGSVDSLSKVIAEAAIKLPPMQSDICTLIPRIAHLKEEVHVSLRDATEKCSKFANALNIHEENKLPARVTAKLN